MKTLLIVWLMLLVVTLPVTAKEKKETRDNTISILKFVPGLHQLKTKKYFKGVLLLGSFVGAVTGAVIYNNKGNNWYDKYRESTNVEDIILFRKNTEDNFKKRNLFVIGIVSAFVLHLIDLKFSRSGKTGVKSEINKDRIDIGFYFKF